ncbi:serine hydrolase domain-containing protein [Deinococcus sp.]|uniref:serine hydrolase domain-containing protein n=1 Tax=Deinococcus sp. TaxID=47478 RepID=UPI003C7E65AC
MTANGLFEVLDGSVIPAVAASVITRGGEHWTYHRGLANVQTGEALTPGHAFDLASLTKVLVALPEVLALLNEGKLSLESRIGDLLPECGWMQEGGLKAQTVAALLTHTGGLDAWRPLYLYPADRSTLLQRLLQSGEWWNPPPGGPVYSDLGFVVLTAVVERLRGVRIDALAALRSGLTFRPVGGAAGTAPAADPRPSVATEVCPWRGRTLQGEVHDENAWALGGVSGHAGAFGTLEQVTDLVERYLDETLLPAEVLRLARREWAAMGSVRRGLGWQLGHPEAFGGARCSPQGYGHTGFTGTSVWIEPERGYAAVLLTNRVHLSRFIHSTEIVRLRRAFHDRVHAELA